MKRNVNPEFVSQDTQGGEREKKRHRDLAGFSYKVIRKINPKILIQGNYLSSYLNSYFNVKSRNNWPSRKTHVCIKRKIHRPTQLKKKTTKKQ